MNDVCRGGAGDQAGCRCEEAVVAAAKRDLIIGTSRDRAAGAADNDGTEVADIDRITDAIDLISTVVYSEIHLVISLVVA